MTPGEYTERLVRRIDCPRCRTPVQLVHLTVRRPDGLVEHGELTLELASKNRHACWMTVPEGANLLVMEDD